MDMIYINLLFIPLNAWIAGVCEPISAKALNAVAVVCNVAVVASHLSKVCA